MRRFLLSTLLATVYGGAASAQTCMLPSDQQAFDVIALKSVLMVGALSCGEGEQYDAFMTQFQPHILAEQHIMDKYFQRAGGLAGQAQEDDYVTLLANSQSATSIGEGAQFCKSSAGLFNTVAALQADGDLDNFATAKPTPQPISKASCQVIDHSLHHRHHADTLIVADNQ